MTNWKRFEHPSSFKTAMKMSDGMNAAVQAHMIKEFYSAWLYLSMAAYFNKMNLTGFYKWMLKQAREEAEHGHKFFSWILERLNTVQLSDIEKPPNIWGSYLEAFQAGLKHEEEVSRSIDGLIELAIKNKDHQAREFLDWFLKEQVEEVAKFDEIVGRLKIAGDNSAALIVLDRSLGKG